jgi:aldose 1-epimerase
MKDGLMLLRHGAFAAEISPEAGALVRSLRWQDKNGRAHELLRASSEPENAAAPSRFGLWPMVPFANRAFGGIVDDGKRRIQLPQNDPETGSTIHGFGWQQPWTVAEQAEDSLVMEHERQSDLDPFAYRASMRVMLRADGIRVELAVTHLGDGPMPYGIGLHPWFAAAPDTCLTLKASSELTFAKAFRAKGRRKLENGGPYGQAAAVDTRETIAHSFMDWDGTALLATPSTGLEIMLTASPSLRHPVVWAPEGADFLCIEPQSHGIGAPSEPVAREATPLSLLPRGETLSGWMEIRPSLFPSTSPL